MLKPILVPGAPFVLVSAVFRRNDASTAAGLVTWSQNPAYDGRAVDRSATGRYVSTRRGAAWRGWASCSKVEILQEMQGGSATFDVDSLAVQYSQ